MRAIERIKATTPKPAAALAEPLPPTEPVSEPTPAETQPAAEVARGPEKPAEPTRAPQDEVSIVVAADAEEFAKRPSAETRSSGIEDKLIQLGLTGVGASANASPKHAAMSAAHLAQPLPVEQYAADEGAQLSQGRRWTVVAGGEYVYARPTFSQATAMYRIVSVPNMIAPVTQTETLIEHDFSYRSNVRGYVALRDQCCCQEIRVSYWRPDASSQVNGNGTFFEVNGPLRARSQVGGDVFDIDYSRKWLHCDECGCCEGCPPWELNWNAGVRYAGMGYRNVVTGGGPNQAMLNVQSQMDFKGAGPKIGMEGALYVGQYRRFALYADWDLALLLGDYEHSLTRTNTPVVGPVNVTRFEADLTRVIPVTEIELGARWMPRENFTVSAGYFMQVWWDLGMTEDNASIVGGLNFFRDDANIMSWDGLTVQAEISF